jgi:hypothetical protein
VGNNNTISKQVAPKVAPPLDQCYTRCTPHPYVAYFFGCDGAVHALLARPPDARQQQRVVRPLCDPLSQFEGAVVLQQEVTELHAEYTQSTRLALYHLSPFRRCWWCAGWSGRLGGRSFFCNRSSTVCVLHARTHQDQAHVYDTLRNL